MALRQQEYQSTSKYLYASRSLAYILGLESKSDFEELISISYSGTFAEYMEDRLFVQCHSDINATSVICIPKDLDKVRNWILPYLKQIERNLIIQKRNYRNYIMEQQIDISDAYVDIGFTGTIQ